MRTFFYPCHARLKAEVDGVRARHDLVALLDGHWIRSDSARAAGCQCVLRTLLEAHVERRPAAEAGT